MDKERSTEKDFGADVLCGANSYNEKYYFNDKFANLPEAVKDELHVMCVLFTEECGGILTVEFLPDGTLVLRTRADEYDFYYDEINAGLGIAKLRQEKKDLLEKLELYYRVLFLKEEM
ncbi:MAG: hypothetical protein IKG97_01070 [Lachnospiraceae bacterium]|nr:hypothetical protein [Lachnospiraceae bacterium]